MSEILKPPCLKKGDTIAIVSPSSTIQPFPRRTKRSVGYLESKGYKVVFMPNAKKNDGYSGGTAQERADDINKAFLDKKIDAILCSTGGLTANAILPYINYDLIHKNPKIFCGYSDITTLLLMITSKANIVTYHGPTLLPSFGEYEGSIGFTFDSFEKMLSSKKACGVLPTAHEIVANNQYWDKEDVESLEMKEAEDIKSFGKSRKISGKVFGGNLQTFTMLMHDKGFFDLEDTILLLEEEGLSTDWYERYITELERLGIFEKINGIIFAKPSNSYKEPNKKIRNLDHILREISDKYDLGILSNVDCGHTKPLLTIPLGIDAEIDTKARTLSIKDAAVC